jgi:sugar lactone lactonase YvrE
MRPADGKVTFLADVKDEFLEGKSILLLTEDFYPTATVQLVAVTSAMLRGVVVDEDMRAVAGATVAVEGYPDAVVTDRLGKFALAAHAGNGQKIDVSAKKGRSIGHVSTPAGKTVEIIMSPE